ncbi:MAG: ATP-binding protein [Bacteroides sp.]
MNMLRRLPISTQDFEKLRNAGDLYVDKTQYIEKLLSLGTVFFLSRPHRFGKSLFLSTLKAYFEGRKELFEGLYIAEREEEIARGQRREPWEASPVLYFDLNAKDYLSGKTLQERLSLQLDFLEAQFDIKPKYDAPDDRFIYLIRMIYQTTQKQVVILVDEYDKPLLETVTNEELNIAIRAQLKAFYEVLKQCDRYIRFAFLTGITKFSKMTLFSGVNNLKDITLDNDYDAICGFTEEELTAYLSPQIAKLAEAENATVEETRATLKKKYDGYCFSRNGVKVYNPFSLLNVLADRAYDYYWFENATPSYLVHYLKRMRIFFPDLDQDVKIGAQVVQDFRYNDHDAIIPLLFQSGYLTIKNTIAKGIIFQLGYPNEEVRFGFLHELLPLYSSLTRSNIDIVVLELYELFDKGDLAEAMKHVSVILAGIIYGNIPNGEEGRPLREQYYQSVLYAVFRLLGVHAQAEVVCATGRIDMLVLTRQHVYIFEFKVNTQGTAQDAIDQIKDREYFRAVSAEGRPVHLVGVSFDEKTRNVGEWKEEILTLVVRP